MPHIVVEHSNNILESINLSEIGKSIHNIFIEVSDTFKMHTLRTRVVSDDYYMADGGDHCFVHLNIELIAGRADEIKQGLIDKTIAYLNEYFASSISEKGCIISIELREINPNLFKYAKVPGTN